MSHDNETPAPGFGRDGLDSTVLPGEAARSKTITVPMPLKADQSIWCSWRNERDPKSGRSTKRPYRSATAWAKSNDRQTWITLRAAGAIAADKSFHAAAANGLCGVGVFLGPDIIPGEVLAGVDLDTCLDAVTGALAPWAQAVLDAVWSYAETSPSGTGVKVFFRLTLDAANFLRQEMGGPGRQGQQWKLPGSDHPPGIELYLGGRYFAMTGQQWPGAPAEIRIVRADDVLRVVREIGPSLKPDVSNAKAKAKSSAEGNGAANGAYHNATDAPDDGDAMARLKKWAELNPKVARLLSGDLSDLANDRSASNVAFCLAGHCKDAGLSEGEARALVRAYRHLDLGKYADDDRQWSRIWARVREGDTPNNDDGDEREPLLINGADLTETAAAVTALLTKSPKLYHRDGPVTVARDPLNGTWATHPLTAHGVTRETHKGARPFKRLADGSAKRDTLPERVALMSLDDKDGWRGLRPIDGFATSPLLSDDGSIRTSEGYDAPSRMFCAAVPDTSVPGLPTRADAERALLLLRRFLRTFAFADAPKVRETFIGDDGKEHSVDAVDLTKPPGHDESSALHALLTALCRPCLWLAPALVVTAPNISGAGAGKGLLVRVLCAIAFGLRPIAITAGHSAEEMEKRIATALIAAHQVLFLDNLNSRALKSDTLASAITERPSEVRIMGTSKSAKIAVASFIAITGNGLTVSEDMARRVLHVVLDAGVEDPESREFPRWRPEAQSTSLLKEAFHNRAELLGAALTIWRWGRQSPDIKAGRAIGSFEDWARSIRDPLVTLGCADPAERIAATKASDPRRAAAAELFVKWNEHHGDNPVAVSVLHPEVREIADPAGRGRQYVNARIRSFVGTRAGGFVLNLSPAVGRWNADKFILRPTQGPGPIGPIGPMGLDGSPMGPMGLDPVAPNNNSTRYEGEL